MCKGKVNPLQQQIVSWDSAVDIATGYWLDDREDGVRLPVGSRIFTSPTYLGLLWGPPNLLSKRYRGHGGVDV
jgi:hypothetical protein